MNQRRLLRSRKKIVQSRRSRLTRIRSRRDRAVKSAHAKGMKEFRVKADYNFSLQLAEIVKQKGVEGLRKARENLFFKNKMDNWLAARSRNHGRPTASLEAVARFIREYAVRLKMRYARLQRIKSRLRHGGSPRRTILNFRTPKRGPRLLE